MTPHRMRLLCLMLLMLAPAACAPRTFQDPIPVMLSRQNDPSKRLEAAEQATKEFRDDPRYAKALDELAWGIGQPENLRLAAMDALIARDEAEFQRVLARRIVLPELSHTVLEHLYRTGIERHWPDFTPTVVFRYAIREYGTPDSERMERWVLTTLNPDKSPEQAVFAVFADADGKVAPRQQHAAWELLARLTPDRAKLTALLRQAPPTTPLVADLQAGVDQLHILVHNREGCLWLAYLRDPQRHDLWEKYRAQVAHLGPDQLDGLDVRHLAALARSDDATLALDRAALMHQVEERIDAGEHHYVTVDPEGGTAELPQRFRDWRDKLCWGDLLTLRSLLGVLSDPKAAAELFAQGDANVQDASTEFGGVLDLQDGQFKAIGYPPFRHGLKTQYTPSQEMIERCYTGVAHYHFHAQKYGNKEYAAPGRGDLETADRLNMSFLVFIFIDRDHLNVDYYQTGQVSIDLGTIRR